MHAVRMMGLAFPVVRCDETRQEKVRLDEQTTEELDENESMFGQTAQRAVGDGER
jgi:hypothetical protein